MVERAVDRPAFDNDRFSVLGGAIADRSFCDEWLAV
jgi:hypothetical protein